MHHDSPAPVTAPFTPAQAEAFHADDKKTATVIVLLMCGIFTIGLFLYLGVFLVVLTYPI